MLHKAKLRLKVCADNFVKILNKSSVGALAGSMIAGLICVLYPGSIVRTGLPVVIDMILVVVVSLLLLLLVFGFSFYLYEFIRKVNRFIIVAIIGAVLLTAFLPDAAFNRPFIFLELFLGILVGIALNKNSNRKKRTVLILLAVVINIAVCAWLFSKGNNHVVPVSEQYWKQNVPVPEAVEDPTQTKAYSVGSLFYGSGTDKRRAEYSKKISLKTNPVDGTPFLQPLSSIKSYLRKSYWGFDINALPLNARVWYPKQEGNFPLVVFVHGNHLMTDYSEEGYEYMGALLAARGFIVVSIDENFLNESWYDDYWFSETNARAWLILKHLEYWRKWNSTEGNPFFGKIDMDNICLVGHSRGADAVAVAFALNKLDRYPFEGNVRFNFGFAIKSMVQIAPVGKPENEINFPLNIKNVNYLLLHGSHDQDIYSFGGIKMYNRITFDSAQNYLKAMLYIYKANHGQFNTAWGLNDNRYPNQFFVSTGTLLNGDEQRKIAKSYIAAFLHATLQGQKQYLPLLKDCRNGFGFLPEDYYINQYDDRSFKYIADFEEDQDLSTATLAGCSIETSGLKNWMEKTLPLRNGEEWGQENTGAFLEWEHTAAKQPAPYYAINVSDTALHHLSPDATGKLFFFIANNSDNIDAVSFSVQIKTRSCVVTKSFNDFYTMAPLLKTQLAKWNYLPELKKDMPVERVLQFVQLPFEVFKKADSRFDPKQIQQIRFIFDKQPAGNIILDRIGIN
ncbi:alpha/beta hydrolase family protein [Niabella aquatica]